MQVHYSFFLLYRYIFLKFQISIRKLFIFYYKIHSFSFIRISFIHTHFWKEYAQRSTCFIIFGNNEIFKILFIEGKPIRYYYFINSYIIYQNRDFLLIKFVLFNFSIIKFYNFLSIFKYGFDFFYNFVNL